MELTGTFTELMRLEADSTESCDGKKTISCRTYSGPLNKVAMNCLCVVLFDIRGVLWR